MNLCWPKVKSIGLHSPSTVTSMVIVGPTPGDTQTDHFIPPLLTPHLQVLS